MTAIDRFLRYVTYDTQSDEHSDAIPSTAKQKVLGAALAEELAQMGLHNAHMDEYGYVYAWRESRAWALSPTWTPPQTRRGRG